MILEQGKYMQQEYEFNRGAVRPVQCLNDACAMLKGYYGSALVVMLIAFLIILISSCLPFMVFIAPIICGIYLCMFAAMERQPFNISTLFKGFDFFGQAFLALLVLSIPLGILSAITQVSLTVMEKTKNTKIESEEDLQTTLYRLGFIFGMLFLIYAASIVIGTLTAFVYPLIVDRKLKAWAALKLGFRAVMGNFFGVVELMLLGQLLMFAGLMLCYIGALLVAPVVFAAWAIAYRRVFPLQISGQTTTNSSTIPQQQNVWMPPFAASKGGWILTIAAVLIVAFGGIGVAAFGGIIYRGILVVAEEERIEKENKKIEKEKIEKEKVEKPVQNETFPPPQLPENTKTPTTDKPITSGVLNGKAIDLPKPVYPAAARAVKASGAVNVLVTVDENGDIIEANAISGHPLLFQSAVAAARQAKFQPTLLSGKPV
ncbi:MAG: TonB family protein, partial [Acidobacteriota bacterium]